MIARNHKQEEHALQGEGCVGEGTAISATSPSAEFDAYSIAVTLPLGESGFQARRGFTSSCSCPLAFRVHPAHPHPLENSRPPRGEVSSYTCSDRAQKRQTLKGRATEFTAKLKLAFSEYNSVARSL